MDRFEENEDQKELHATQLPPQLQAPRRRSVERNDEEFGADLSASAPLIAPPVSERLKEEKLDGDKAEFTEQEGVTAAKGGQTVGWIGLVLAIASMFIYPVLLGLAALVMGVVAFIQGSRGVGAWSAAIGAISLLAYFFLVPYYT
ncbi:hypothetical protein ACFFNY_02985 [Paenibacillus hodogayensis]|uniref:DUF4190 domain-containing protein n=1 Tax=Paenibacillus hodogayensis TaxID=279208 RepID=A0ABV5VQI0_9BACL